MEIAIAILAALGAVWAAVQLGRPERPRDQARTVTVRALPPRRHTRVR